MAELAAIRAESEIIMRKINIISTTKAFTQKENMKMANTLFDQALNISVKTLDDTLQINDIETMFVREVDNNGDPFKVATIVCKDAIYDLSGTAVVDDVLTLIDVNSEDKITSVLVAKVTSKNNREYLTILDYNI